MAGSDSEKKLVVNIGEAFHPYEEKSLTATQPDTPVLTGRDPFNDFIKHGDIVVGHQRNRTLSDYPRKARPMIRLYSIVSLALIVGGIIWNALR